MLHVPSQRFLFFLLFRFGEITDVAVHVCFHLRHRAEVQRSPRSWTVGKTERSCDPHGPRFQKVWEEACRPEKDPNERLDEAKWMDVGQGGPHQLTSTLHQCRRWVQEHISLRKRKRKRQNLQWMARPVLSVAGKNLATCLCPCPGPRAKSRTPLASPEAFPAR